MTPELGISIIFIIALFFLTGVVFAFDREVDSLEKTIVNERKISTASFDYVHKRLTVLNERLNDLYDEVLTPQKSTGARKTTKKVTRG